MHLLSYIPILLIVFIANIPILDAKEQAAKIIFINHARDYTNSWKIFRNGLVAGMNNLNINIEIRNPPTGNLDDMERLVQTAINAKPDGLILSVPRQELALKWTMHAQQKNIPVILVGSLGISHFENQGNFPLISIGADAYQSGFNAGKKLKNDALTTAICFVPRTDTDEYLQRCRGTSDGIGKPIAIFSLDKIGVDLVKFLTLYLKKNKNLQTIIMTETDQLKILYKALRTIKREDIGIVTFGLTRDSAYLIRQKTQILFAVDSQPFLQGYMAVMIFNNYYQHGVLWGSTHVSTGPHMITSNNIASIVSFAGSIR